MAFFELPMLAAFSALRLLKVETSHAESSNMEETTASDAIAEGSGSLASSLSMTTFPYSHRLSNRAGYSNLDMALFPLKLGARFHSLVHIHEICPSMTPIFRICLFLLGKSSPMPAKCRFSLCFGALEDRPLPCVCCC